jgi:hypothetical protein
MIATATAAHLRSTREATAALSPWREEEMFDISLAQ